jgi:hypothetical protein
VITVSLLGQDVSNLIQGLPALPLASGTFGQLCVSNLPELVAINDSGFWDIQNPASPFYGAPSLSGYTIDVYNGGVLVMAGTIQSIMADYASATATVMIRGSLQAALEQGCEYVSTNGATPSALVSDLLTVYGFAVDPGSFGAAEAIFAADNVSLYARFLDPALSIMDALQMVCELTCSRIYVVNDVFYMDTYTTLTTDPIVTFQDRRETGQPNTIWSKGGPSTTDLEKEASGGYVVQWAGSPDASFGNTTSARKTISGKNDQPLTITDFDTAVWIGRQWNTYLNRPQQQITFGVPPDYGAQLALGFPVAIDYHRWAGAVTVDLIGIDNSDPAVTTLTGLTR